MPAPIPSPFLTTEQAAARIGVAPVTLKKMRTAGGGPPYLIVGPRRVLYDVAKFDEWVRGREYRSTSEYPDKAA